MHGSASASAGTPRARRSGLALNISPRQRRAALTDLIGPGIARAVASPDMPPDGPGSPDPESSVPPLRCTCTLSGIEAQCGHEGRARPRNAERVQGRSICCSDCAGFDMWRAMTKCRACAVQRLGRRVPVWIPIGIVACVLASVLVGCAGARESRVEDAIDEVAIPLMERERIPGMAVGVVHGGRTTIRCFGVACRETERAVDADTLFEIGSISKTFTALLGAMAAVDGRLRLTDPVGLHAPEFADVPFGRVTLLQLATYCEGGFPLQAPAGVDGSTIVEYLRAWSPEHPAGTMRRYSNVSIGVFGWICAEASGRPFEELMSGAVLPALGLRDTCVSVPPSASDRYAFGYDGEDQPVRVRPGQFDAEAYGIKTSVSEMCRYLRIQMDPHAAGALAPAVAITHTGQYSVGSMTQALGWECYAYPTSVEDLLAGNSREVILEPQRTAPCRASSGPLLFNKTGSTGGFGAYALFVPERRIGIVILANRSYPIAERVRAAHAILRAVDSAR